MATVIDKRSESHDFFFEKVSTTLTLVETSPDTFGIYYDATYTGVVPNGSTHGGPITVSANGNWKVEPDSRATIDITVGNYSDDKANKVVSLHITIDVTVHLSVIGNKTVRIFDQTLGGKYSINVAEAILNHLELAASR